MFIYALALAGSRLRLGKDVPSFAILIFGGVYDTSLVSSASLWLNLYFRVFQCFSLNFMFFSCIFKFSVYFCNRFCSGLHDSASFGADYKQYLIIFFECKFSQENGD